MGYRSEVVLVVGKEVMPQFMVTMAKSAEARAMCFAEHDKMIKDYDGEGNMLFAWDCIKWYDSYEGIAAIGTDFHVFRIAIRRGFEFWGSPGTIPFMEIISAGTADLLPVAVIEGRCDGPTRPIIGNVLS